MLVEQSLQTDTGISKWRNFVTRSGRNYKEEHAFLQSSATSNYYKMGQELLATGNLLLSGAAATAKWGRYYKVGQLYYKVGQVLHSEAVIQSMGVHKPKVNQRFGQKNVLQKRETFTGR